VIRCGNTLPNVDTDSLANWPFRADKPARNRNFASGSEAKNKNGKGDTGIPKDRRSRLSPLRKAVRCRNTSLHLTHMGPHFKLNALLQCLLA
jgi:hypothetical protein